MTDLLPRFSGSRRFAAQAQNSLCRSSFAFRTAPSWEPRPLRRLDFSGTPIEDADLAGLRRQTSLEWLNLAGTRITDQGLSQVASFPQLKTLVLSCTGVTDAGLQHLYKVRGLETVFLVDTRVTYSGVDGLRRALPGLSVR